MTKDDFAYIFKDIKVNTSRPVNQDCWVFQAFLTFWGKIESVNSMYPFNYYSIGTNGSNDINVQTQIEDEVREALIECVVNDLLYDVATINVEHYESFDEEEFGTKEVYDNYKKSVDRNNENMRKLAMYEDDDVFLIPIEYVESKNVRRIPA